MPLTPEQLETIRILIEGDGTADPPIRGVEDILSDMAVERDYIRALLIVHEAISANAECVSAAQMVKDNLAGLATELEELLG